MRYQVGLQGHEETRWVATAELDGLHFRLLMRLQGGLLMLISSSDINSEHKPPVNHIEPRLHDTTLPLIATR